MHELLLGCPTPPPPRGARPVINSVFGRLCGKTYSGGREDTRSGTEERCSHKWFHTIFPLIVPTLMHEYFLYLALAPPENPEGAANQEGYLRCLKRFDDRSHFSSFVTVRV